MDFNGLRSKQDDKTTPRKAPRRSSKTGEVNSWMETSLTKAFGQDLSIKPSSPRQTMGSSYSYSRLLRSLQSVEFSHLFIYILFLTSVTFGHSKRCDIDKCSKHFRSISEKDDPAKRCRHLTLHSECLRKMNMACRGNLLYHTSAHISEKELGKWNCSYLSPNTVNAINPTPRTNQCVYAGKPKFKFCSLFGDPHVRTFSDKFHTCKANGSWRLINNNYLVVKATNSLLPGQMRATAISKLVVIIRESGGCAEKKIYRAEIGNQLPEHFEDGATHTGHDKSVNITVKNPGQEVQIDIRFIATTIVIRHVGSHLAFSIQMPEELVDPVDRREQMCVKGCSRRQRIPLSQEIKRLTGGAEPPTEGIEKYNESEARRKCRDVLLQEERETSNEILERKKRSTGKGSKKKRKGELDSKASAASWKLLYGDDSPNPRPLSSSKKSKSRRRNSNPKPKESDLEFFVHDDPAVGRFSGSRNGRRDHGKAVVSSVGRGTNFYFEACVFDLMTTGDLTYASSARGAFDDVTRFHRFGSRARGASKKVIVSWTVQNTTTHPVKSTSPRNIAPTLRTNEADSPTTESSAGNVILNFPLFVLCLVSTTYTLNINLFGIIFQFLNTFFNAKRLKT